MLCTYYVKNSIRQEQGKKKIVFKYPLLFIPLGHVPPTYLWGETDKPLFDLNNKEMKLIKDGPV